MICAAYADLNSAASIIFAVGALAGIALAIMVGPTEGGRKP